jgi:hypothetical protein
MNRSIIFIALGLLAGCSDEPSGSPPSSPADKAMILPGTFAESTTLADLEALFGKANVKAASTPAEYGADMVLFPDDPARRAYVRFYDSDATHLSSISIRDAGSRWRGKQGVRIGMSLAELQKLNGKPFYFTGFNEQGSWVVHDSWSPYLSDTEAHPIGNLDVGDDEHMYFDVDLGLRDQGKNIPPDAYPRNERDKSNSVDSDDPRYPRLGEIVEITGFSATTSLDDEWQ